MNQWGRELRRLVSRPVSSHKVDTLLETATKLGWAPDRSARLFLNQLERRLRGQRPAELAVLAEEPGSMLARTLEARFPGARVRVLDGVSEQTHAVLSAHGPFDVIVDASPPEQASQVTRLRHVFLHLKPRGEYAVNSARTEKADDSDAESLWSFVSRLFGGGASDHDDGGKMKAYDERELAKAMTSLTVDSNLLTITNGTRALPKLRDSEIDIVLALRRPGTGAVLETLPSTEFTSRCVVRDNAESRDRRLRATYSVPALTLRAYDDVICAPGQVAIKDGLLLPETYRHHLYPRLENRFTKERTRNFAVPVRDTSEPRELSGSYFYLDSEWPGHFGHVMTEQVSRLWAWPAAKRANPDLKALLALPAKQTALKPFEIEIFSAAGIPPEDLVGISGAVRVERLLGATPMLSNPNYIHPQIRETWDRIGRALTGSLPPREYPTRFFCSRRSNYKRSCHNLDEVEAYFAGNGFEIVYPEDHGVAEQAAMFAQAGVVAGFAGSALFNLCYSTGSTRVIMICPESYTARNEYMISSVIGHEIDLIWCTPDLPQPERGFDGKAFASAFSFDFSREGKYLADVLASLP